MCSFQRGHKLCQIIFELRGGNRGINGEMCCITSDSKITLITLVYTIQILEIL
jgi:hypothetical protein